MSRLEDKQKTADGQLKKSPMTREGISPDNVLEMSTARHTYDVGAVNAFLDRVFHAGLYEHEHILTWVTKRTPGYPISDESLTRMLPRLSIAKAVYMGTATVRKDPRDDRLYNRQSLFESLRVVVLDDIGTKVSLSKLPCAMLKPTYIIQTSEGNYQYGYVLKTPITDLLQAQTLIQLIYDAGVSDGGGKMPTKVVRLPAGVNGKPGQKGLFHVKLIHAQGELWTPEALLDSLDLGVQWTAVVADAQDVIRTRSPKSVGLSAWSPVIPVSPTLTGVIDPVLEWLYDQHMVKQETNDWATVQCPWSDQHTDGDGTAGYSPLGRGDAQYTSSRGFKCFHEHCADKTAGDFLGFVAANDGPCAGVKEHAVHLLTTYAYDPVRHGVWNVKKPGEALFIPLPGFKGLHPHKTNVITASGKTLRIPETTLYLQSPLRVDVCGPTFNPYTTHRIVPFDGILKFNTHQCSPWGEGEYDPEHVKQFVDFLDYLIPDATDRHFFLDWLGAKVQSLAFRGPAILMVARQQGTGRTTLGNLLMTLLGTHNVEHIPFSHIYSDSAYNNWRLIPLVITDETRTEDTWEAYRRTYEKIKENIDTAPQRIRVNPKYGMQYYDTSYTSFLLFSNHVDALHLAHNDRRIYVMNNALKHAPIEYFTKLHKWFEAVDDKGLPLWARAVWRWLRVRDIDLETLNKNVTVTVAKQDMLESSLTATDIAVECVLSHWPCLLICAGQVTDILTPFILRLNLDTKTLNNVVRRQVRDKGVKIQGHGGAKHCLPGGQPVRVRAIIDNITPDQRQLFLTNKATTEDIREEMDKMPMPGTDAYAQLVTQIDSALTDHDF